jgi:hypothetical protein
MLGERERHVFVEYIFNLIFLYYFLAKCHVKNTYYLISV